MGKKKKKKGEKKAPQKDTAAIDERAKKAMALSGPDENPFKMANENKIDRFRYLHRTDRRPIKQKLRHTRRETRPHKSTKKTY